MEITIKGIPIYYDIRGSGTPILMIHGWSVDHRLMSGCMEPVLAEGDGWQRIYFDLPGMGRTPGPDWIGGSDDMLSVILEFIDQVIPNQHFLLAGESYGGYLARGLLKARREWIDGVLFICPVGRQKSERELPEFKVLEEDKALVASLTEEEKKYFTGITVVQNRRVWDLYKRDVLPALKIADYDFLEHKLSRHVPFAEDVDVVTTPYPQPTLFVMGRQDFMVGYRDQWDLIELYPRASYIVLDKAGHNLQTEQAAIFTVAVKEWLDRVRAESVQS